MNDFQTIILGDIQTLVQEGKSKKAKVKRKNAYFVSFLAILNGWFIFLSVPKLKIHQPRT